MEMNDKNNINKTFDINDLCSSIDHQASKRQYSFSGEIHHELEISEINQKHRLSSKLEKRLHYQKEIESLQKMLKDDFKNEKNKNFSNEISKSLQNKLEEEFKNKKISNMSKNEDDFKNDKNGNKPMSIIILHYNK